MKSFRAITIFILLGLILSAGCGRSDAVSAPSVTIGTSDHTAIASTSSPATPNTSNHAATPLTSTASPLAQPKNALTEWAQTSADLPRGSEITLKRTICFGACPIYSVRIDADGKIEFVGQEHVSHTGKSTGQITTAQVRQLVQQFAAIDFFELRDQYGAMGDCPAYATDHPSVIISLRFASETKTVELYLGCIGGPEAQAVAQLGEQIDTTINSQQWIK